MADPPADGRTCSRHERHYGKVTSGGRVHPLGRDAPTSHTVRFCLLRQWRGYLSGRRDLYHASYFNLK